jgi:hypothetical protein
MVDDLFGMYLTVQANGDLYFNDIDIETGGALWKGSCPLGACGAFVRQSPTTAFPGGLRSRSGDSELIEIDSGNASGTFRRSYSLPSYDQVKCRMLEFPRGFDMDAAQKTIWYADEAHNKFVEMTYGCVIIGAVNGEVNGDPSGAAVDSPEPL